MLADSDVENNILKMNYVDINEVIFVLTNVWQIFYCSLFNVKGGDEVLLDSFKVLDGRKKNGDFFMNIKAIEK
jgi:hypothetical protein